MKTRFLTIFIVLLAAMALAACGGTATPTTGTGTSSTPAAMAPIAQRTRAGGVAGSTTTPAAAQPAATATPVTSSAAVPTAVPIPVITVPTAQPARTPEAKPAATASTSPVPATTSTAVVLPAATKQWTLDELRGKIVFFSDRDGGYPQLYVMNGDGSNQQLCNCSDVLEGVVEQEVTSPDGNQYLYVTTVGGGRGGGDYQIWAHRIASNDDVPVTGGAPGFPGVDYDPAWSPNARYIAWVSETNGFDEIYRFDRETNENIRLTESAGEWYKHPTFSPDGTQIAYWTNVENVERKQIWVMDLDGGGKHNISDNDYNDWDPLWVK